MIRNLFVMTLGLLATATARADWALNMPRGVTKLSAETYDLHMLIFYVCCAIGVLVFGVMIYSLLLHRKSRGVEAASFSHNTTAEIVWTAIPALILILMAVPSAETMIKLEDSRNPDLSIVVTGYQWKWHYEYQGENVAFFSSLDRSSDEARRKDSGIDPYTIDNYLLEVDRRLVVPRGAKVRLLVTANDVIHSWWVPDLAIKKDAIPGFINETWFRAEESGIYRGQCTELCGKDHGFMPVVVEVVEPEEFQAFLASEQDRSTRLASTN